jgi:radical SAM superfamily enzyme YgiQ (UPF0313 family)
MIHRPARTRSAERVLELSEANYRATGYDQVALSSLSSSDHPDLEKILQECCERFESRYVDLSLPSLRVSDQLSLLPKYLSKVRKSGLTVAPEAATQRLRAVINKDISEEDLIAGATAAYREGWQHLKLYFMVGLPTETDEDVRRIVDLCNRVSDTRKEVSNGPGKVNVTVSTFVPKPHTPFQWEPMIPLDEITRRRGLILEQDPPGRIRFKFHTAERSFLEGAVARGDRRLGRVIERVARNGGQLEAWDDWFELERWIEAFDAEGLSMDSYATRRRGEDEFLPWDHIDCGVKKEFLLEERKRAFQEEMTPDCRFSSCHRCGACS